MQNCASLPEEAVCEDLLAFAQLQWKKPLEFAIMRVCPLPFSERSGPVARYVNRGLLNFGGNGWRRGWGGCGSTLNGKPGLLCALVMAGDYRAKQKDWMNAPPQIGRSPSSHPLPPLPLLHS